ncbi:MAG: tetratricopeptide repeat protein [Pseudomonadota bacterium]|nr:tetratricopeptide repeat protein [Pseudomonadota bacterium]
MKFIKSTLLLAILVLMAGCASTADRGSLFGSDEFEMPESVTIDLTGEEPEEKSEAAPSTDAAPVTEATEPAAPAAEQQTAVRDADSAAVLERLKQPGTEPVTRDPEQVKQANAARSDYNRALAEMRKGNLDSAQARFTKLNAEYPLLAGPIVNQAIILRKKGQTQQAYDLLQKSILQHGKNPRLLNELGLLSRQLGKFKQAQVSYESAIRIDERYAVAHYNLAVLADLYLHDPVLALKEFETYQTLIPEPDKKVSGWIVELQRRAARTQ